METKKLTYLDVLNDTINHYNINNRSLDENGNCLYHNKNGESCAVGRYINNIKEFIANNNNLNEGSFTELYQKYNITFLKKEVQHLDNKLFWVKLQELHDDEFFWNETGLSEDGLYQLKQIKTFINPFGNEN